MSSATDTVNTSDVKPSINDFDVETQRAVSPTPGGPPTMIMPVAPTPGGPPTMIMPVAPTPGGPPTMIMPVAPTPGGPPAMIMPIAYCRPALFRVKCGYCRDIFQFHSRSCLARCPHCRRTSSVGGYANQRATISGILGVVFLLVGIGVTAGTYERAKKSGGFYVVWIGAFLVGILNILRCCNYGSMTVSSIEEEPSAVVWKQLP